LKRSLEKHTKNKQRKGGKENRKGGKMEVKKKGVTSLGGWFHGQSETTTKKKLKKRKKKKKISK